MARGIGIAVLLLIFGAIGFAYSGVYDVSASAPHSGLVSWYLATTSHAAIERKAGAISVLSTREPPIWATPPIT